MFEIGSSLREARVRNGLEIADVERATKIRGKYLRALENDSFDVLPSQAYVRGFLRSYADFLGLEGNLFVDEYTSRFWVDEEQGSKRARRIRVREQHHRRAERNMVLFTIVAIGVVTALVIAAWNYGGGSPEASIPNLSRATAPRAPTPAFLTVRAVDGSSLLEVRRWSARGKVLFHGTLERSESQRFDSKHLWLNIGSPENLRVKLKGQLATLGVGCPQVVVVTPRQVTSKSTCG
jgi:cytoskeleton protein RodZ